MKVRFYQNINNPNKCVEVHEYSNYTVRLAQLRFYLNSKPNERPTIENVQVEYPCPYTKRRKTGVKGFYRVTKKYLNTILLKSEYGTHYKEVSYNEMLHNVLVNMQKDFDDTKRKYA